LRLSGREFVADCRRHDGATPYNSGRYAKVVQQFHLPAIKWKLRAYNYLQIRMHVSVLIPDPERWEELLRLLVTETGLDDCDEA
jgi:hypothetical protein